MVALISSISLRLVMARLYQRGGVRPNDSYLTLLRLEAGYATEGGPLGLLAATDSGSTALPPLARPRATAPPSDRKLCTAERVVARSARKSAASGSCGVSCAAPRARLV